MVWYAGGHDGGNPGTALRGEIADWMAFHLQSKGADPGTGFEYAVQGAFRTQRHAVVAHRRRAHLSGPGNGSTERRTLKMTGREQVAVNPPGGNPASISNLPGLGSALSRSSAISSRLSLDLPGQAAVPPRTPDSQLLLTGSSTVRLRVARGDQDSGEAILFAKLYDVSADGTRVLPGSAVAPFRVAAASGRFRRRGDRDAARHVRPVESEHKLALVVSTTDQAFANATSPPRTASPSPPSRSRCRWLPAATSRPASPRPHCGAS